MSFIHPLLLGGLLLAGLPIIMHLIMQQKPKHLLFPAFRFLQQKYRTNQRKIRLRHLLLLLLRILVIVFITLALARPRVLSERLGFTAEQPVAAVLVIDTSPSMEYAVNGVSRLDEAKERVKELLEELAEGSRVAVLDTAGYSSSWLSSMAGAREVVAEMTIRPGARPVTDALANALKLFGELGGESTPGSDELVRVLYIFSDRTAGCWEPSRAADLVSAKSKLEPPTIGGLWVDLGVEKPVNLGITNIEMPRQAVPANQPVRFAVTVSAVGADVDTELSMRVDGERLATTQPVKLAAGTSRIVEFERRDLSPGLHQVEFTLATADAMPFDNRRYATVEVLGARRVLTLVDEPAEGKFWKLALDNVGLFACEVQRADDAYLRPLTPEDLRQYRVVCLLSVANPNRLDLWQRLEQYVQSGGQLIVLPGGEEMDRAAYNKPAPAQRLLPGSFEELLSMPEGASWGEPNYRHPLFAPFREWVQRNDIDFIQRPPTALRFWEVKEKDKSQVLVRYNLPNRNPDEQPPAVLEQTFPQSKGRVLLFTTPFDGRRDIADRPWNDYLQSSFFLVIANQAASYLAGDTDDEQLNFTNGQIVRLELPTAPRFPKYTLSGPGVPGNEAILERAPDQNELRIRATVNAAGNFVVTGGKGEWVGGYSLNPPGIESNLERVPVEQIESVLGPGCVLPLTKDSKLTEAIRGSGNQPVELFPLLMVALLLVLTVENLLANRFYRQAPGSPAAPAALARSGG
jgi:hypothetical protein